MQILDESHEAVRDDVAQNEWLEGENERLSAQLIEAQGREKALKEVIAMHFSFSK